MNLKKTLLCFALAASCLQSKSQNEQWAIPPKNYNLNGTTPSVASIPNAPTATTISNGAYDASGNLLFYIIGSNIYNPLSSIPIGGLPDVYSQNGTSGLAIVPIPGQEYCNKFYVFYINTAGLCYVEIDYNGGSIICPSTTTTFPNNSDPHILLKLTAYDFGLISAPVVSKEISSTPTNIRYLFVLAGNPGSPSNTSSGIYRFTIGSSIGSPTLIAANSVLHTTSSSINYFDPSWAPTNQLCNQISLSPDQTRLGWGGGIIGGVTMPNATYSDQNVCEIKLSSTYGYVSNSFQVYTMTSGLNPNWEDQFVAGFTYDAAGHMYASTRTGIYYSSGYGVGFWLISGSSSHTYNSSNSTIGSQLQYVPSSNLVVGAYPTSTANTGDFFSINSSLGFSAYLSGSTIKSVGLGSDGISEFLLPYQIAGDATIYPTLLPSISVTNTVMCSGSSITVNSSYTGNTTPNNYYWEITETDAVGHVIAGGYSWNSWFPGAPSASGPYTLPSSYTSGGTSYNITCGNYYRITYALQDTNVCYGWAATSQSIYLACSPAPVITGTNVCSGSTATLCVNNYTNPDYSFGWTAPGKKGTTLYFGSTPCVTVTPNSSTYSVTVTDNITSCETTVPFTLNIQNIQPNFSISATSGPGGTSSTYYTIETFGQTTSSDPTFAYWWGIKEVTGSGPYTTVPNTEVDNPTVGCFWTGSAPNWFSGYYATNIPQYTTGVDPSFMTCGSPSQGYFLKGHEYMVTYGTWSGTCLWKAISSVAYICSGCKEAEGGHNINFSSDLTYEEAMGIKNQSNNQTFNEVSNINIYPNPNNGNFTIETKGTMVQLIEIFDLTGRLVLSKPITGTTNINVSDLTNGIYNVKISTNGNVENKRVVISK